ncbi:MAG: Mov34/MPN/PAD-1 family protein [Pseudomonadota bacterium]
MTRILIPKAISNQIQIERQRAHPLETGGFLNGMRRGADIEITGLTTASPGDLASFNHFERRSAHHRQQLAKSWAVSKGLVSLIGDWHSHPVGNGVASNLDKKGWKKLVRAMRAHGVGLIATAETLQVYHLRAPSLRSTTELFKLTEATESDLVYARE